MKGEFFPIFYLKYIECFECIGKVKRIPKAAPIFQCLTFPSGRMSKWLSGDFLGAKLPTCPKCPKCHFLRLLSFCTKYCGEVTNRPRRIKREIDTFPLYWDGFGKTVQYTKIRLWIFSFNFTLCWCRTAATVSQCILWATKNWCSAFDMHSTHKNLVVLSNGNSNIVPIIPMPTNLAFALSWSYIHANAIMENVIKLISVRWKQ